jgi:murein L,D-transpeptidase YcbB/YkuD
MAQATALRLELNVPAYRLDVRLDSILVRSYSVAVGMRSFKTPVGSFEITHVVWNPWWQPPASDWAKEDTLTPPGPTNPMGKVKLAIREEYYLHGTPAATSIGTAASHGCVRMRNEDAVDLARLLQNETQAAIDSVGLDSLLSSWNVTRTVDLPAPVPIQVLYRLAEVRDATLTLYRDIYREQNGSVRDRAVTALAAAGYDTTRIVPPALAAFLERAVRGTASIAVDSLMWQDTIPVRDRAVTPTASRLSPSAQLRTPSKECV